MGEVERLKREVEKYKAICYDKQASMELMVSQVSAIIQGTGGQSSSEHDAEMQKAQETIRDLERKLQESQRTATEHL